MTREYSAMGKASVAPEAMEGLHVHDVPIHRCIRDAKHLVSVRVPVSAVRALVSDK